MPWGSQLLLVDGEVDGQHQEQLVVTKGLATDKGIRSSNLPQATTNGHAFPADRGRTQFGLLLATVIVLVAAIATMIFVLLKPWNAGAERLVLSTSRVAIDDTYFANASGCSPRGEYTVLLDRSDQRCDGCLYRRLEWEPFESSLGA